MYTNNENRQYRGWKIENCCNIFVLFFFVPSNRTIFGLHSPFYSIQITDFDDFFSVSLHPFALASEGM